MRNFLAKRLFDILFSFFGIIISLPLWLMVSILIFAEDRGSIYYTQDRIGKDEKIFKMIKFRSMKINAEKNTGPIQAQEGDLRTTQVGRFLRNTALDELPQLINILKGDMSFVGPRPLRPDEIENITKVHTDLLSRSDVKTRQSITPGLTGVAQVLEPRDISFGEKVKYDIWYLKNNSINLDICLIGVSFLITFLGRWETRDKYKARLCVRLEQVLVSD